MTPAFESRRGCHYAPAPRCWYFCCFCVSFALPHHCLTTASPLPDVILSPESSHLLHESVGARREAEVALGYVHPPPVVLDPFHLPVPRSKHTAHIIFYLTHRMLGTLAGGEQKRCLFPACTGCRTTASLPRGHLALLPREEHANYSSRDPNTV